MGVGDGGRQVSMSTVASGASGRPASARLGTVRPTSARPGSARPGSARPSSKRGPHFDGLVANTNAEIDALKRTEKLQEAAINRCANAQLREALQDQNRIYDSHKEKKWAVKYQFFSGGHMKASYRTFAKARHDPFNKDPSWGDGVIKRVADAYTKQGVVDPMEMFKGLEISSDGKLSRPILKKVLISVLPDLSDFEVATIFDALGTISGDKNEVSVREFCEALQSGRMAKPGCTKSSGRRWRNPLHRFKRYPPARVEGWDHLDGASKQERFDELCDREQQAMAERLESVLQSPSPRATFTGRPNTSKYQYFSGGGDVDRFARRTWRSEKSEDKAQTGEAVVALAAGEKKPDMPMASSSAYGWLCDAVGQATYRSFYTPRRGATPVHTSTPRAAPRSPMHWG